MNIAVGSESLSVALEAARRLRAGEDFWFCGAEVAAPVGRAAAACAAAVLRRAAAFHSPRGCWFAQAGEGRFLLLTETPLDVEQARASFEDALRRLGARAARLRLGQVRCSPGAYADLDDVRRAARENARLGREEMTMQTKMTSQHDWRKAGTFLVLLGFAWLATACAGPRSRVHQGKVDGVIEQDPTRRGYVEAIGIGASDPSLPTDTQRKALSRDAAIVKAQYELLSMVKGVTLEGGVSVERAIETGSVLETSLNEAIRGAEVLRSEFTADNGCVVTMRLPRARLERMMGVKFR